jgi:hypothetical protein
MTCPRTGLGRPRDHVDLTGEFSRIVFGDGALAIAFGLHDLHLAGENNEHRDSDVADIKDDFSRRNLPDLAVGSCSLDLGRRESGKRLSRGDKRADRQNSFRS